MAWYGVITDAGKDAIEAHLASGAGLNINVIKTGTGTVERSQMTSVTDMVAYADTGSIVGKEGTNEGAKVEVSIQAATTRYVMKEVGLFATLQDSSTVLIAYYNDDSVGVEIPTSADFPDFNFTLYCLLDVINSEDLDITIDPSAYVSMAKIKNNLTTPATDDGFVLDARQGKVLNDMVAKTLPSNEGTTDQFLRKSATGGGYWAAPATATEIANAVGDWLEENVTQSENYIEVDQSLMIPNAAADSKVTGDKLTEIKSAIKLYDAVEIAPFTDSGSYSIGTVGSVVGNPTLSTSSTMLCYKFSCSPGDVFEFDIYGSGTSSGGARAYGWLNANNEVISRADRSVKVEGIQYAPEGAAYLVVNTLKTYGGYVIKGNRISEELIENDNNWKGVHNLIPANTKSRSFVWKSAGSDSYPTGWRTGYIDNTGTYQSSNSYIRTVLIPSAKIKGATACLVVPPTGYFAWVDVFINDYTGSENFVAQYGNYFKQETGKEIYFTLSEGQSFVVSLGKFNSDAGDYLTETFTKTIGCTLFFSNKSDYAGKKLSLLGDSISALAGDIPEGNRVYYTGSNMGILNSSQMWYSVLCNELGMIPLVINGWSGSCVTSGVRSDSTYKPASDASRCEALHDGTTNPDVVLIAMGVNDYSYMENANQFGTWDGSTALGEQSDMSDYINTDFKRAYATMIARIRRKYPEAQIVCITPWFVCRKTTDTGVTYLNAIGKKENDYGEAIREIASIMNVQVVDGTNIGLNRYNMYPTYAEDSSSIPTHPNATGHALMGHAIATQLVNLPAK